LPIDQRAVVYSKLVVTKRDPGVAALNSMRMAFVQLGELSVRRQQCGRAVAAHSAWTREAVGEASRAVITIGDRYAVAPSKEADTTD
jgi:hypothetical protein